MISIAITDDETLFRRGISFLIEDFDGMTLYGEASNGKALLDLLAEADSLPDVLLLDLQMPELNGVETARILRDKYPAIKVVILSTHFSKPFVINMLEIGAAAYLPKNSEPAEVEHTINTVVEKGFCYSDKVMEIIRENMNSRKRPGKISFKVQLTKREKEVLQLICKQYTNLEIAKQLFVSARTVDGHRQNLLDKLNCKNTAGLVAFAIQQMLVEIDPSQFWG